MLRSVVVFGLLVFVKALSRVFYRHELTWVGGAPPPEPFRRIRLVVFLNHTSLFEPVFLGVAPNHFIWRLARHGVIPAAAKTTRRPLVGLFYKFVAAHVVPITRERDDTWFAVVDRIDPESMVVIAPEGRMMRANGLDADGKPMTVRGGIADILDAIPEGRMLLAYSGGLHHVQVPGRRPNVFETVRIRVEVVEIGAYKAGLRGQGSTEDFRSLVKADLESRRDRHRPN